MENSKGKKKQGIQVVKEEGNLLVIDPNKTVDGEERYVAQEDLVYFVNLEADVTPRSILDLGGEINPNSVGKTVATGKVNYLGPNDGQPLTTRWTEDFTASKMKNSDDSPVNRKTVVGIDEKNSVGYQNFDYKLDNKYNSQLLGIKDVKIVAKPDNLKTSVVTIRMVDIRGRALFEKGAGSIYSNFFHLPYPLFTLTVKGFYGQAVTYSLVLTDSVKVDFQNDGDYYLTATFMATNQKLLNDIRLQDAIVAPYLFETKKINSNVEGDVQVCKNTKGFDILTEIYREYAEEGLISENLGEKPLTLPQLIEYINSYDIKVEKNLFDDADISFFSDIAKYGEKLKQLSAAVKDWFEKYVNINNPVTDPKTNEVYMFFKKEFEGGIKTKSVTDSSGNKKNKQIDIIKGGVDESLKSIIENLTKELSEFKYFGQNKKVEVTAGGDKTKKTPIEYTKPKISGINNFNNLFYQGNTKGFKMVNSVFESEMEKVVNEYNAQYQSIKDQVSKILNKIQEKELGFKPTLKNVMGVIFANMDCFLRVMEDIHEQAYKQRTNKDRLKTVNDDDQNPDNTSSLGRDVVYPFPTVYGRDAKTGAVEQVYPGDPKIKHLTNGAQFDTWPEVKLTNEYVNTIINDTDGKVGNVCSGNPNDIISENTKEVDKFNIFASDTVYNDDIYSETEYTKIVYSIYNRAIYSVFGTGFKESTIKELAKKDAINAANRINRLINGKAFFRLETQVFRQLYNEQFLPKDTQLIYTANDNILTDSVEKELEEDNSYLVYSTDDDSKVIDNFEKVFTAEFKKYEETGLEPYPFTDSQWVSDNLKYKSNPFNRTASFNKDNSLQYAYSVSPGDATYSSYIDNSINPLQTPKFVSGDDLFAKSYWLLQTQITKSLLDEYNSDTSENYFARFLGGDIKEIDRLQILKWGSSWYRYTNWLDNGVDVIDSVWGNADISGYTPSTIVTNGESYSLSYDKTSSRFDVGFYPELIARIVKDVTNKDINIQDEIDNGSLIVFSPGNITVNGVDENQTVKTIRTWKSYYNFEGQIIKLPSYIEGENPLDNIKEEDIDFIINRSFSQDWYRDSQFDYDFNELTKPLPTENPFNGKGELISESIESLTSLFSYEVLEKFKTQFLEFTKSKYDVNDDNGDYCVESLYEGLITLTEFNNLSEDLSSHLTEGGTLSVLSSSGLNATDRIIFNKAINVSYELLTALTSLTSDELSQKYGIFTSIDNNEFDRINGPLTDSFLEVERRKFFEINNISANEINMKKFKGIISVYCQWLKNNPSGDMDNFKSFIGGTALGGVESKLDTYIDSMFTEFGSLVKDDEITQNTESNTMLGDNYAVYGATYRSLKNLNDTWIGGRISWKNNNIAKLFKYLDFHNNPIGDEFIMDTSVLKDYYNSENKPKSIGSFISLLLQKNSLSEPISLGASTNYFGNLVSGSDNIQDAVEVANTIFGVHTNVFSKSLPGFVVYFRSHTSEYLNIVKSDYGYKDDGLYAAGNKKNGLSRSLTDSEQQKIIREGNRAVSFNVDFGVQNQNMFNNFAITSYEGTKSSDQLKVAEAVANQNNGAPTTTIATNLLELMKTRVYGCTIQSMGNVMIQPFMYFNLRYVPIYSGTYLILSVEHSMSPDTGIMTSFTGVRVSNAGTGKLEVAMVKASKNLLDNLIKKLNVRQRKLKEEKLAQQYSGDTDFKGNSSKDGTKNFTVTSSCTLGENWKDLPAYEGGRIWTKVTDAKLVGIIKTAMSNLGYSSLTQENLGRFMFAVMKREQGRGNGAEFWMDNPFGYHVDGGAESAFKSRVKGYFCISTSDGYKRSTALFHDPDTETVDVGLVRSLEAFAIKFKSRGENYYNNSNYWNESVVVINGPLSSDALASLWAFNWNTKYEAVKGGNGKGKLISDYDNGRVVYTKGLIKEYYSSIKSFQNFMNTFDKLYD